MTDGPGKVSAAKLTEKQVREIRARYRYRNGRLLAEEYGVATSTIHGIVRRKSWAWLK